MCVCVRERASRRARNDGWMAEHRIYEEGSTGSERNENLKLNVFSSEWLSSCQADKTRSLLVFKFLKPIRIGAIGAIYEISLTCLTPGKSLLKT